MRDNIKEKRFFKKKLALNDDEIDLNDLNG